jgi:hypothetical protein
VHSQQQQQQQQRSTEDLEVMPYLYDSGTHRYQMSFQGFTVTPWMADSERPKLCCPVKMMNIIRERA